MRSYAISLAIVGLFGTAASAAVVTDPTLSGPGADTFDPAGFEEVDFTPDPSSSMDTLEARSDIRSIQTSPASPLATTRSPSQTRPCRTSSFA